MSEYPQLSPEMQDVMSRLAERKGLDPNEVLGKAATLSAFLDQEPPSSE